MQVRSRDGRLSSRSLVLWLTVVAAGAGCGTSASGSGTGEGGSSSASGGHGGTGGSSTGADGAVASGGAVGVGSGGATSGAAGATTAAGGTTGFGGATSGASGGTTGFGGGSSTGGALGAGGSAGGGGLKAAGGAAGASQSGGSKGTGGNPGSGGAVASGGTIGSGAGGTTGNGGATASGGTTGAGGTTGKGGSTASGGATGTGGGGTGLGGSAAPSFCPANAIFCADFEEASGVPVSHPVGTATFQDPTEAAATFGAEDVMFLDTSAPYEGTQSLAVTPSSTANSRTLAVSVPSTFWVRLYLKSDQAIGQTNENAFFGAGTSPTYHTGNYVVLAEQLGCLFLDKNSTLYPVDQTCGVNAPLAANVWHCIMAAFDGATGNVQVFSGTTQIINATGWAPAKEAFNTFEFGIFADNPSGATVWYDDVAISSSPLACP